MRKAHPQKQTPAYFQMIGFLFCVVFMLSFLSGCTLRTPSMNKLDSLTFSANLKTDANAAYGKKAAFLDGRIYYLSSELGTSGIYSMNTAGEEIKLEIPVEDIRAISVQEDGIYYSGFAGIQQNINGSYRQFRLFQRKAGSGNSVDLLKTFSINDDLKDENVWDFYLSNNKTCIIRFVNAVDYSWSFGLSAISIQDSKAVPFQQYEMLEDSSLSAQTDSNHALLSIAQLDHLLFMLENYPHSNSLTEELLQGISSLSVYDTQRSCVALSIDRLFSSDSAYTAASSERWFCRIIDSKMILTTVHGFDVYDIKTKSISEVATISRHDYVYQYIDCGDNILVFTEQLRNTYWKNFFATRWFHQNRALAETLYRLNPETGDLVRLLRVGRNNAFLYANASIAVTGGGKTISIYDISVDKAELKRTINVTHNIVDSTNKVDTAGGWLFLYRFNEVTQRDELIEKVYIGS